MLAIEFLDTYAKRRRDRPFRLSPTDVSRSIESTAQVVGMAQEKIVAELKLRKHDVVYEKVNSKRHFLFR